MGGHNALVAPNTFIIGAPKCGTTALASYLASHPQVFFSEPKEPLFWSQGDITRASHEPRFQNVSDYLGLFAGADPKCHKVVAEGSTRYLYAPSAVPQICEAFPDSRFVVLLRNPVDAIPSFLTENQLTGWDQSRSLDEALRRSADSAFPRPHPADYFGNYSFGFLLSRLARSVPTERVLILIQEDMREDPRATYLRCLEFLGVDDDGRSDFPIVNGRRAARSRLVNRLVIDPPRPLERTMLELRRVVRSSPAGGIGRRLTTTSVERIPVSEHARDCITSVLAPDVRTLAGMIERDLGVWGSWW